VDRLKIPVCLTIGSMDLLGEAHPYCMGRFGPLGQRRANFTIQNADLMLALGSSLSLSTIGFNTEGFAPRAKKIMVNVDAHEIGKARPVPDLGIDADVREFIEQLLALQAPNWGGRLDPWWLACRYWRSHYQPLTQDYFADKEHVNTYAFGAALSDMLENDDVVLTGNSLDWWSLYQTFQVKDGQRVFTNLNYGAMGWDLPAAIGACAARTGRRTILVTGDGTIQFNIQELQTIAHNRLDLKIFILNNGGYASIRTTQQAYFGGHLVGSDTKSGVSSPSFKALAEAYGLRYSVIHNNDEIAAVAGSALAGLEPILCEVMVAYEQGRSPRIMSRRRADGSMESGTLENMYPFLPEEEIARNMNIFQTEVWPK
jgi:acetolactate synthase-1/2/3 large subunit